MLEPSLFLYSGYSPAKIQKNHKISKNPKKKNHKRFLKKALNREKCSWKKLVDPLSIRFVSLHFIPPFRFHLCKVVPSSSLAMHPIKDLLSARLRSISIFWKTSSMRGIFLSSDCQSHYAELFHKQWPHLDLHKITIWGLMIREACSLCSPCQNRIILWSVTFDLTHRMNPSYRRHCDTHFWT